MELSQQINDVKLAEMLSISRATVWRWVKNGALPQPRKLGRNSTRWDVAEVNKAIKGIKQ